MYTFVRTSVGAYLTLSRKSRISSIPRLEAASISTTSSIDPFVICWHASQALHGSGAGPCSQLTALAITLAALVFPVPRGPENRYAWENRCCLNAFCSVRVTCCCPTISENVCG